MRLTLDDGAGNSLMLTFIARNRQGYRHLMDLLHLPPDDGPRETPTDY
ncbi:MAG: hypothetical protein ACLSH6_07420 [Limosilactobacillus pontis]